MRKFIRKKDRLLDEKVEGGQNCIVREIGKVVFVIRWKREVNSI